MIRIDKSGIKTAFIAISAAVFLFAAQAGWCETRDVKKVSFVTLWLPQAQFAGYYTALEKGIYKKYGLDVTIINGGPDNPPFLLLQNGTADFGIMWLSTAIEKKSQGIDIVNIAQIVQRSGLMLVAKKSSGILKPADINNKKVGLWDAEFEIQPHAFFKKYGLTVQAVPQSYSVNLFLSDGVDVASAMWYNEYHTILNSGYDPDELTAFFFYEHGLNSPEDGIYAMEKTLRKDPAMASAFVKASLEGWRYAFEHTDEAVDIVLGYMERAHVPANRAHQKWQLERIRDLTLINGSYAGMGELSAQEYRNVAVALEDSALIKTIPTFETFHKKVSAYDTE